MKDRVFLVHGWSVTETTTYQALHLQLAAQGFHLDELYLGRYVSLEDRVDIADLALAMHNALEELLDGDWNTPFHIITHSTGALVVRSWVLQHYRGDYSLNFPLQNLIFLAGPHFGSRLAHHGRSMLAQVRFLGETGERLLENLELGSEFSWGLADGWFDPRIWLDKEIKPYCLVGDRVSKSLGERMAAKVFPAAYEPGSDMVVRCAAANLNCTRYELDCVNSELKKTGEICGVPFAALGEYVHSGSDAGIMNSIKRRTRLDKHPALQLILRSLRVRSDADYSKVDSLFRGVTLKTRGKKPGFAQLDFRFIDQQGDPVTDYVVRLGCLDKKGNPLPLPAVCHTHKNRRSPNHFTVFIDPARIDPEQTCFLEIDCHSGSKLFSYQPTPCRVDVAARSKLLSELICTDRTTQIDVRLERTPESSLFVFHPGNDPLLHLRWDRQGEITKTHLKAD